MFNHGAKILEIFSVIVTHHQLWLNFILASAIMLSSNVLALGLSDLSPDEKESLTLACKNTEEREICFQKHLYALEKVGRTTSYSELHPVENLALENSCVESFEKGPALYVYCMKREFSAWRESTHVNLAAINNETRESLFRRCDHKLSSGLLIFSECMVETLATIVAETQSTDGKESGSEKKRKEPSRSTETAKSRSEIPITPAQLFKKISPSIVYIETELGSGSGVAISPVLILTNQHVIEGATNIKIFSEKYSYFGNIVTADQEKDTCILRVKTPSFLPVSGTRRYKDLEIGETVYTLGNPKGLTKTISDGLISGKRVVEGQNMIQITAPITYGSSGGGLFDGTGNLIGITTGGFDEGNLNFAIPIEEFMKD